MSSTATMSPIICIVFLLLTVSHALPTDEPTVDNFQIEDFLSVSRNDYKSNDVSGRSDSIEDNIETYVKTHDVAFKVPVIGSAVTITAKNLDKNEVDFKLNFNDGQVEARKSSKLKKIVGPILIFVLLKAMTLIPLALGILGIKTWNALQLAFFSFIISIGMAVYQMCRKVVGDHVPPPIVAGHSPWETEHYAARSYNRDDGQKLAYSAYLKS